MSIQKKIESKVIASLKSQQPTCGDCVGFDCEILRDKQLCRTNGILESEKPCRKFVPNTNKLMSVVRDVDLFMQLAEMIGRVNDGQLRNLGALIMREKQTRDEGFHIGMKVYVRFRGAGSSNYMSNFMSAYIMYADQTTVRVASRDGKLSMTFAGKAKSAIYVPEKFEVMRSRMLNQGKFVDPEVQKHVGKHLRCLELYELGIVDDIDKEEIPTIDKVFKSNNIRKPKAAPDLVSIVRAIEKGYSVSSENESKKRKTATRSSRKSAQNTDDGINVSY